MVMGESERGQMKGILGPVAGLLRVESAYTVAIETALGSAMQNIVVEREEDGKAAILGLGGRSGLYRFLLPQSLHLLGQGTSALAQLICLSLLLGNLGLQSLAFGPGSICSPRWKSSLRVIPRR